MKSRPLINFASHHRLMMAIVGAIAIAITMTVISLSLYVTSGAQVLDLSRPGFEQARRAVQESPFETKTFQQEGPINSEVVNEFEGLFGQYRDELTGVDDFEDSKVLSDKSLGISANQE